MTGRTLALCDSRRRHILARLVARDGEAVIEYSSTVVGLARRTGKHGRRSDVDASWSTFPLDSEDGAVGTSAYCASCAREFFLPFPAVVGVARTIGAPPLVLQPIRYPPAPERRVGFWDT